MAAPFTIGLPSITVGGYRKWRTLNSVRHFLRPRSTLAPVATQQIDYVGMVRWTSNFRPADRAGAGRRSLGRHIVAKVGSPADRLAVHFDLDTAVDGVGVLDLAVQVGQ